jgi:hypothetical protein
MLEHLGAGLDDYLAKVPASEIEAQITLCSRCGNTETCDSCLRDGREIFDMGFCPNYWSLTAHSKTVASTSRRLRWPCCWDTGR